MMTALTAFEMSKPILTPAKVRFMYTVHKVKVLLHTSNLSSALHSMAFNTDRVI